MHKEVKPNITIEKIFIFLKFGVIYCKCCGTIKKIKIKSENLREDCICKKCSSSTRKRHIAIIFLELLQKKFNLKINSLTTIPFTEGIKIYNLESYGALHTCLKHTKDYVCSEYFGSEDDFGKSHNGILNVDLMNTPFKDNSFDYIISSEVFEHIPHPYKAFKETYRILKKGGAHIFTIPYYPFADKDETRAILNDKNEIVHLLEPEYHGDILRVAKGVLVFTIFSKEMHHKLEEIGFSVTLDHKKDYKHGILGNNNFVFTATKL